MAAPRVAGAPARNHVNQLGDPQDANIVKAIVTLGASLNLQVIAEGVETAEQRDALVNLGCTHFQG